MISGTLEVQVYLTCENCFTKTISSNTWKLTTAPAGKCYSQHAQRYQLMLSASRHVSSASALALSTERRASELRISPAASLRLASQTNRKDQGNHKIGAM